MKMFGRNNRGAGGSGINPASMGSYDEEDYNNNNPTRGEHHDPTNRNAATIVSDEEDSSYGPTPPPPPPGNEEYVQSSIYGTNDNNISNIDDNDTDGGSYIDSTNEYTRNRTGMTTNGSESAGAYTTPVSDIDEPVTGVVKKSRFGRLFGTRKNSSAQQPIETSRSNVSGFNLDDDDSNANDQDVVLLHNMPDPPLDGTGNKSGGIHNQRDIRNTSSQDDYDDDVDADEEMSVEIPPTTVVQRMIAQEKYGNGDDDDESSEGIQKHRGHVNGTVRNVTIMAVTCCAVILAVVLGVGYGTGAFGSSSPNSPSSGGGKNSTGTASDPTRAAAITSYLSSVVPGGESTISNVNTPEGMAATWLGTDDPLALSPDTDDVSKQRLLQRYALLTLWFNSESEWGSETGWSDGTEDECTWFGLTCVDSDSAGIPTVRNISLVSNNVQGTIPPALSLLSHLSVLNLNGNGLTGSIPENITSLDRLRELDVSSNKFRSISIK
jgi:Leucine rich repeat